MSPGVCIISLPVHAFIRLSRFVVLKHRPVSLFITVFYRPYLLQIINRFLLFYFLLHASDA